MSQKTSTGLSENIAGLLCYAFTLLSGIIMLVIERENKFVRFHALQSTIWFGLLTLLNWVVGLLSGVPFMGFISALLGILTLASWIYLMYMAFKGHMFKLPMIGEVAWAQVNK